MNDKLKISTENCGYAKTKTVFQMEATECGAAVLAMMLSYYGKKVSLEETRVEVGVSRDGAKAGNIMRAATKYHMEVHGYRKELERLLKLKPPCIIHWNFNHFVVYEGVKNGKVHINDPAVGHRRLTLEEFDDSYTGIVITMVPSEGFEKQKRKDSFLKLGMERLQGQYGSVLAMVLIGVMLVLPSFLTAAFSQIFIDQIYVDSNHRWLGIFISVILLNLLFQVVFTCIQNHILLKQQNKMALLSAQKFLSHMFRLPMAFFEQRYSGDLSNRIANNDKVSLFLGGELTETVICLLESLFYLIILLFYSPYLVVVALFGLFIDLTLILFSSSRIREISMKMNQDSGKMTGALYAGLSIIDSIKATGSENEFVGRLLGYYAKTCNTEQNMSKTQQMLNAFPQAIMQGLNVLLLMLGSILVIQSKMTVGSLVAFTSLFAAFLNPINKLLTFVYSIQMTKSDMERVKDIMEYSEERKYQKEDHYEGRLEGNVKVENITFGYSKVNEAEIKNVSLNVEKGDSIAIIGASGSGKSTLAKVISGLYEPWEGQIFLDGRPLHEISVSTMHISVTDVSQHVTIFGTTVRDNITLWNQSIPDEDVLQAAKDACIHDVITSRPGAYDAMLSEGGRNLSGGERQRLEIARALVMNPSIIIMDEATSALDPIVEKQVIDNIRKRGCTCIVVAHRLSAIRDCKQILVMDKGRIVEQGTHESLMENGALYQKLIQLN